MMKRSWYARAVWAFAAVGAGILWWWQDPTLTAVPAIVDAPRHRLGPVEPARLAAVYVQAGDAVQPGQPLAQFECTEVDAELAVARGLLHENLAEVESVAVELAVDARQRRLGVETDLARIRATLAETRGQQEARQAELATLNAELKRLDEVIRSRVAQADRLTDLRTRQERLSRETRYAPEAVLAWSEVATQVRDALDAMNRDISVRLGPYRARIETQAQRVQQLLERHDRCTLRAPAAGNISQVLHAPGDAISAGTDVIILVGQLSMSATAYISEGAADSLVGGAPVELSARDRYGISARGVVERVGPEIVELPARLWPLPDRPRYGRAVHIRLNEASGLLPGELAFVRGVRGTVEAATRAANEPYPAAIPEKLRARSRLELSGAVWVPAWDRFVVVSDDTGFPDRDEHRPWVFTADADGRFDAEPRPIRGIESVSDLEGIAIDGEGKVYLLASQSLSRNGRRPRKRQWLLRAEAQDGALSVTGQIALYDDLLAGLDLDRRVELGVSDQLDIEGIAAYRGGLILGLKSPLDSTGRARLWYLADADGVFKSDGGGGENRRAAGVSLFAAVFLPTCAAGAGGGISDLLVEGDRLFALSTLPDGLPCGSAWSIDLPLGDAQPRKLADWPQFKPEGIARSAGGNLMIFFDTGFDPPRVASLANG